MNMLPNMIVGNKINHEIFDEVFMYYFCCLQHFVKTWDWAQ